MRKLYFLLPGMGGKFACGGLWAELKTVAIAAQICPTEVITYRQREKDCLFLDDVLKRGDFREQIFVVSWGFDVPKLIDRLQKYHLVYHAHSSGYGFKLPASIPIITVSRNTMGYWGQMAPNSLIYYLPNQIAQEFDNFHQERDIDVLVQARKSSSYLLQQLVPVLQKQCRVEVVNSFVEDLPALFNRAKVYLYDSAEYWAMQGVSEGFGLQPMEALACGCQVFSSVNGGLSDYLDPGFNCYKIAGYSRDYDTKRILNAVHNPQISGLSEAVLSEYRRDNIISRLQVILQDINQFFDQNITADSLIPELTKLRRFQLLTQKVISKVKSRF